VAAPVIEGAASASEADDRQTIEAPSAEPARRSRSPFRPIPLWSGRPAQPPQIAGAQDLQESRGPVEPRDILPPDLPSPLAEGPARSAAAAAETRAADARPQVAFRGTMEYGGETVAILEHKGRTLFLAEGDVVPGQPWRVVVVSGDQVELEHTGEQDLQRVALTASDE
jgi:hypothetical protein